MESTESTKAAISTDDAPDRGSRTMPIVGKLKQSRYEDVWPEDVHAAFMEAVALYPPMGKRRLKYFRFSNANQAKSFGRCQLIQSYILEKTGKNRSRKQVSSHLQRLKKIHKDNPAMLHLFSECSQPPLERCTATQPLAYTISSQDSSNSATRHFKTECDSVIKLPDTGVGSVSSSTSSYTSETSSSGIPCSPLNLWTDFQDQLPFFTSEAVPKRHAPDVLQSCDTEYFIESEEALLFKDAINEGFRSASAFNTSAFSMSMRRNGSKFPMVDMGPTAHISRAADSSEMLPAFYDDSMNVSPLNSNPVTFNTPHDLLFRLAPSEKRYDTGLTSEWIRPYNPSILIGSQEGYLDEVLLRYSATCQYCPEVRHDIPAPPHNLSSENRVPRLPRGLSCNSHTLPTTAAVAEDKGAADSPRESPGSCNNLASPLLISPIAVYPISYVHSDIHPSTHSGGHSPTASHPP